MGREYLYIELMRCRSRRVKKRSEPVFAMGRKTSRCPSSESCSWDDSKSFSWIATEADLSVLSESMSALFSSRLPSEAARSSSSFCSMPSSSILSLSSAASSAIFCCSSTGCSCWMVTPSSCSSRPASVTEKLTSEMSDATSGGRSGVGLRVARNMRKPSV